MSATGTCQLCEKRKTVSKYEDTENILCIDCAKLVDDTTQVEQLKKAKTDAKKLVKKGKKTEAEKLVTKASKKLSKKIKREQQKQINKEKTTIYVVGTSAVIKSKANKKNGKIVKTQKMLDNLPTRREKLQKRLLALDEKEKKYLNRIDNFKRDRYINIYEHIVDINDRSKKEVTHYGVTSDGAGFVQVKGGQDKWFYHGLTLKNEVMKLNEANGKVKERKIKNRILDKSSGIVATEK